ncbi:Pre-mRNA-splicing factor, variant 2 [Bonamia ostreae]|uniref:Pre-mRNA-splicing factor, variant 2 n=1 Tax=Bonamia ostreae TaxID=126728 RepID=A0ABV2APH1_9EUKA
MSGVGNFNKENKTLFIGRVPGKATDINNLLYHHFSEWGDIEEINIPSDKSMAFIRFQFRSSAEIAKVAMDCQSLGFGDILQIRWAHEDPNPKRRRAAEEAEKTQAKKKLVQRATKILQKTDLANLEQNLITKNENEIFLREKIAQENEEFEKKIGEYQNWLNIVDNDDFKDNVQNNNNLENDNNDLIEPPGISNKTNFENITNKNYEKMSLSDMETNFENTTNKNYEKMSLSDMDKISNKTNFENTTDKNYEKTSLSDMDQHILNQKDGQNLTLKPPPGIKRKGKKIVKKNGFPNKNLEIRFSTKPLKLKNPKKYKFPDINKQIDNALKK